MAPTDSTRPRTTTARRAGTVALWALQVALAVSFAGAGLAKIGGEPQMVEMFTQIGAGQWFRYLVGALELAGAIGLLIPRLAGPAALGLATLMFGATVTNILVLRASPALSLILLRPPVSSPGSAALSSKPWPLRTPADPHRRPSSAWRICGPT